MAALQRVPQETVSSLNLDVDPKHRAGNLIQRGQSERPRPGPTVVTMGRRSQIHDIERVTRAEPSHGFVAIAAWQALVGAYAPKAANDPAIALAARELKEKLTAWSLKVAEYEHQFKVHAWQWEMVPKDIERLVLTMGVRR